MSELINDWIAARPGTWLRELVDTYKIDVSRDDGLVSLKYNQIESPMGERVVQQCRGLVVEEATGRVLSHPYDKFWNLGESLAAPVDWSSALLMDKMDGSLMQLYERDGEWCVASSGHPTAGGSYGRGNERTFRDEFWRVFDASKMALPNGSEGIGWFFELVAPDNRIVVKYDRPALVLHGARDRCFGAELGIEELDAAARAYGWTMCASTIVRSPEEAIEEAALVDPVGGEGFVVVDRSFNRVKVKSPRYVALHRLRDKVTPRAVIQLWKAGGQEVSEVLAYFPEFSTQVQAVVDAIERAAASAYEAYDRLRRLPTRKDFALALRDIDAPWSPTCFKLLDVGASDRGAARAVFAASGDAFLERVVAAAGIEVVP